MITTDIVSKLWNLCNILKDGGVTYHQYVTELTYLLFLKMVKETGTEDQLQADHRWADLEVRAAPDRLEFYKILLIHLGSHGSPLVQGIFANASSFIKKPGTLSTRWPRSTRSTGAACTAKTWATFTKACWKRTPTKILRLPTGIFYAPGVKTNVLFFTRGETDMDNSREVWVYDLRANMPQYGKRTQLMDEHFKAFEAAFGDDPLGHSENLAKRIDDGETGRFRRYTREQIAERGDSLDIAWLKDDSVTDVLDLPEPAVLAQEAIGELEAAMEEIRGILEELGLEESV